MSKSLSDNVKNGLLAFGCAPFSCDKNNDPAQYADRQHAYFARQSRLQICEMAKYGSDYFYASVEGLRPDAPHEWTDTYIRMANVKRTATTGGKNYDDYKSVLIADANITYLRPGTKIRTQGSTWLVTDADNLSGFLASGTMRRCNAVWNYLDFWGNVRSEPIVIENTLASANDSDAQESGLITKGYFNIICQCNDATRQLDTNSRIILGTGAYRITGYSDFNMEFTGDYDSVRLFNFSARYEDVNREIDDMENHVAGGKAFSWVVRMNGTPTLKINDTVRFTAESERNEETLPKNGEAACAPRYIWESSDPLVAACDANGEVTGIAEGTAVITATLAQNEKYKAEYTVSVSAEAPEPFVSFVGAIPRSFSAYETATLEAAYFENGDKTDEPVLFSFENAPESSYTVTREGNAISVSCRYGSVKPLVVTAQKDAYQASVEIRLKGV